MVKENSLPTSGSLVTAMWPPISSTSRLEMDNPSPGSTEAAGDRAVGLVEGLEKPVHLLRSDANTRIPDFEPDGDRGFVLFLQASLQDDLAFVGELDGVVGQVEQHLSQPQGIANGAGWEPYCGP